MRIGLVSPYSWDIPGGVNDHVSNLAAQLERQGHEPWILAPLGGVTRHTPAPDLPPRFVSAGTSVPWRANGSRAHVNVWPLMLQRMERLLKAARFDLLHVHEPCVPSTSASSVLSAGCPVVGTFHRAGDSWLGYTLFAPLARWVIDRLDTRIAVSEEARDYVAARFPGEYRIIPNGVQVDQYAVARQAAKAPGRIIFVGRADPRKGLAVLLRAFKLVREVLPTASLVLVGTSADEACETMLPLWHRGEWPPAGVHALGRLSQDDKIKEMGHAEVMCVPSLHGESFGLVLTEAMAAGLPLVASDLPAYRRVLRGGELGQLFPLGDVEALAATLVNVLNDGHLRATLTTRGIQAVQDFAWEHVAAKIVETYQETANMHAPHGLTPIRTLRRLQTGPLAKSRSR